MKIVYIGNKEEQIIMKVGHIKKGEPKEVPDEVARDLVDGKNYIEYIEFEPPVVINSPRYEPPILDTTPTVEMVPITEYPISMKIITTDDKPSKDDIVLEIKKTKKWHKKH